MKFLRIDFLVTLSRHSTGKRSSANLTVSINSEESKQGLPGEYPGWVGAGWWRVKASHRSAGTRQLNTSREVWRRGHLHPFYVVVTRPTITAGVS